MNENKRLSLKLLILPFTCTILTILILIFNLNFNSIIEKYIQKNLVIKPQSNLYDFWINPPAKVFRKFYFFDIKNPKQVEKGSKPILIQRGPFVYKEKWEKRNVEFLNDNLVKYTPVTYLEFSPELSNGTEDDQITVLNLPAIIYVETGSKQISSQFVNIILQSLDTKLFITKTVKDIISGYEDPLMKFSNKIVPDIVKDSKFSLLNGENGSELFNYTMMTGADSAYNIGKIVSWNGLNSLNHWKDEYANTINGSDGTFFPPFRNKNQKVYVFNPNMCRSFHLVFLKENIYKNTKVYDFHLPKNIFANTTNNPDNVGFCGESCLGNGVLNISTCYHGAPGFISQPHFLNADQKFIDSVRGLNPNESIHDLVLHFEPLTGVSIAGNIRFQINFLLKRNRNIEIMKNINEVLLPIMWFDSELELSDSIKHQLSSISLYISLTDIMVLVIFFTAAAIALISNSYLIYWLIKYFFIHKNDTNDKFSKIKFSQNL